MNQLISANTPAITMSSLELVEYINSQRGEGEAVLRHRDFTAKVPKVLGDKMCENFRASLKDAYGRDQPGFAFPKREACLMAMSYSYELQAKVFDRMTALEQKAALEQFNIPKTYVEALRLAADATEQKERLSAQLAIAAPKVEAFERIAESDGCLGLQAAGKALQQKPNKFIGWLREQGWIYRRAGSMINLGRAEKVNAGYVTHKVTTVLRDDGSEKIVEQTMITPKGLTKLALLLNVNTLPKAA